MSSLFSIRDFPRAILHVDGDAFFASCEQAMHRELRGKPVVTGMERGIASAVSYEAKALGVKRAMPIHEIRRLFPECIIVPSDYESYGLFSLRMYEIVRRYTNVVEEYSIDECFADITGQRRSKRMSYEKIAAQIKKDLDTELGLTFSVGLAPSKVLAKVASKWDKPSGLTIIPGKKAHLFLKDLPVGDLWGIGENTERFLLGEGVHTALDLAQKERLWIEEHLSKPYRAIWSELRGELVYPVEQAQKQVYKSISKTRTFTPPSKEKSFIFSQLSGNIENACIKARRHKLMAQSIQVILKTQSFAYQSIRLKLSHPVAVPEKILPLIREAFQDLYQPKQYYRATGIVLEKLTSAPVQPDIFGEVSKIEKREQIHQSVDQINKRYGKHTVFLGSSHQVHSHAVRTGARNVLPSRQEILLQGESKRKRLRIPIIGEVE